MPKLRLVIYDVEAQAGDNRTVVPVRLIFGLRVLRGYRCVLDAVVGRNVLEVLDNKPWAFIRQKAVKKAIFVHHVLKNVSINI